LQSSPHNKRSEGVCKVAARLPPASRTSKKGLEQQPQTQSPPLLSYHADSDVHIVKRAAAVAEQKGRGMNQCVGSECAGEQDLFDIKSGNTSATTFCHDDTLKDKQPENRHRRGEFQWCSMQTTNGPRSSHCAMSPRPRASWCREFVISPTRRCRSSQSAALPARFHANAPAGSYAAAARLEAPAGTSSVSAAREFDLPRYTRAPSQPDEFSAALWAGPGPRAVAGLCVVALVHTERLARQPLAIADRLRTNYAPRSPACACTARIARRGVGRPTRSSDYAIGLLKSCPPGPCRSPKRARLHAPRAWCASNRSSRVWRSGGFVVTASNASPRTRSRRSSHRDCPSPDHSRKKCDSDRDAIAGNHPDLVDNAEKFARTAGNREFRVVLSSADHS